MNNDTLETIIRPEICRVIALHHLNKVDVAHAFWQKGSKCCTGCSTKKHIEHLCSLVEDCHGPANTKAYFTEGVWKTPITFMRKGNEMKFKLEHGPLFNNVRTLKSG
jgi:hypothetical protein